MKSQSLKQTAFLGMWSFLCVLPLLLKVGPNVVTLTYLEGTQRFYETGNPYLPPSEGRDFFFYPPFFAFIWKGFAWFGPKVGILLWGLLNSFVFWWGVSRWVTFSKKRSAWTWFFLICCAVELDISLRYQQANALMAGLILVALAEFKERHFGRAGFLLALGTHLKIFPILIAGFLFLPFHLAFGASFLGSLLLLFLLPASIVGVPEAVWLHWEQIRSTTQDFSQRQLLDLVAFFNRFGLPHVGRVAQVGTAVIGGVILFLSRVRIPHSRFPWGVLYSSFVSLLLAVTPKAESPTFVWVAPAYLLLFPKETRQERWLMAGVGFCLTLVYSSLFPRPWVSFLTQDYNSKVLANFILWGLSSFLLIREIIFQKQEAPVN
ncbi:MAG: DUF2029 domain-containing protein [Proteobacteria bacterium]|nr:DUF2029 domain-containing protein [Pseudomonadota bacterium]